MPTLAEINGYRIAIYNNVGNLYDLPQVCVWRLGAEAEFLIGYEHRPQIILRRSYGLSASELLDVEQLVLQFARELRGTWLNGFT
jgi:hypothetical protein